MMYQLVVRIFLLAALLLFVGCGDEKSSTAPEDYTTLIELGEFTYGEFKVRTPGYPIFEHLDDEYDIFAVGNGPKSRVMRIKRAATPCNNDAVNEMRMDFFITCDGSICEGYPKQTIKFYPFGEYFQTLVNAPSSDDYDPDKDGRLLVFAENVKKAGFIVGDVQLVAMPTNAQRLSIQAFDCITEPSPQTLPSI